MFAVAKGDFYVFKKAFLFLPHVILGCGMQYQGVKQSTRLCSWGGAVWLSHEVPSVPSVPSVMAREAVVCGSVDVLYVFVQKEGAEARICRAFEGCLVVQCL